MRRLAMIFVALNAVDLTVTLVMLSNGGYELNPVMRFMFEQPVWVVILFKTLTPAILATGLVALRRRWVLKTVTIAIACVCAFNIIGIVAGF